MAEDVKLVLRYRVEANAPLAYQKPILLMEGDKRANVLQVSLFDGEKPVDVTGLTVGGSVLRADGADVAIEGEIDGNVISCVLSEYAYAVAGPFKAYVQLLDSLGDVKRTVLLLAGMVESRGHGPQIDTGKELPNLDDILAQLETMRNVTQAANTATGDANAAAAAANSAASNATGAANSATTAAGTANEAADRANNAAQNWEEGTVKNANKLGGKPPEYYLQPVNLLDNSDFRNPVNQRGYASGTELGTYKFFIDRWTTYNPGGSFTINENGITTGSIHMRQVLEKKKLIGKTLTFAIKCSDGTMAVQSGVVPAGSEWANFINSNQNGISIVASNTSDTQIYVRLSAGSKSIIWAALYEGSYTAETMPPYVPKGYAVELAECERYYQRYKLQVAPLQGETARRRYVIPYRTKFRLTPTVTIISATEYNLATADTGATFIVNTTSNEYTRLNANGDVSTASGLFAGIELEASADL